MSNPSRGLNEDAVDQAVRDAATVVLLREAQAGIEVFMLRRGGSTTVMNDAYVFPGGKVDAADADAAAVLRFGQPVDAARALGESGLSDAQATALFVAACRETEEETGVFLRTDALTPMSRWITPKVPAMMRRRFDTRFFAAALPEGATPVHDGAEADESEWFTPRAALQACHEARIALAPPQIMTLAGLAAYRHLADLMADLRRRVPSLIEPFPFKDPESGDRAVAYPGDPLHPVKERAMRGPTRMVWRQNHFEPPGGFEAFFSAADLG